MISKCTVVAKSSRWFIVFHFSLQLWTPLCLSLWNTLLAMLNTTDLPSTSQVPPIPLLITPCTHTPRSLPSYLVAFLKNSLYKRKTERSPGMRLLPPVSHDLWFPHPLTFSPLTFSPLTFSPSHPLTSLPHSLLTRLPPPASHDLWAALSGISSLDLLMPNMVVFVQC